MGNWASFDEQKDRQEEFFILVCLVWSLTFAWENCPKGDKKPFVEGKCLVIHCDFQRRRSYSKSSSGTVIEARQPEMSLQALI